MDGERGHTRVEVSLEEGQSLGDCIDSLSEMSGSLRSHRSGWFHCGHLAIHGFIGACTGTYIQNCLRRAKSLVDETCNGGVRLAV